MAKNPHAQALGRLGGLARAASLTPAQRRKAAAKAGKHCPGWPKGKPRGTQTQTQTRQRNKP